MLRRPIYPSVRCVTQLHFLCRLYSCLLDNWFSYGCHLTTLLPWRAIKPIEELVPHINTHSLSLMLVHHIHACIYGAQKHFMYETILSITVISIDHPMVSVCDRKEKTDKSFCYRPLCIGRCVGRCVCLSTYPSRSHLGYRMQFL